MTLESLIVTAREQGASDLHLEPGLPPAFRIRGTLRVGTEAVPAEVLLEWARGLLDGDEWRNFLVRRSADLSQSIQGGRCRFNILHSARGVGMVIRLLSGFQASIEKLNLHPDLKKLVAHHNGLILVSGPTGSGKTSTLAALIQEVNLTEPRHIVTIESPIEHVFQPRRAFIRQREVGRDTPSFEQALLDSLREDPDVLMVGEIREPETMRLTLSAAETGHLVMTSVHSSNCGEAVQRIISAFPSEIQNNIAAQLADSLVAVIAQRLRFRPELNMRVPECEVLIPNNPAKVHIRNRDFFKLASVIETGAEYGMWTYQRYTNWLDKRKDWYIPQPDGAAEVKNQEIPGNRLPRPPESTALEKKAKALEPAQTAEGGPIEIKPVEGGLEQILKRLK